MLSNARNIVISLILVGSCLSNSDCAHAQSTMAQLNMLYQQVQRFPDSDRAHYLYANALLQAGQKQQAIEHYRAAYKLTLSAAMAASCQKALNYYGISTASIVREPPQLKTARSRMTPAGTGSLQEFNNMASARGGYNARETPGGVEVFKEAPEYGAGPLGEEWRHWDEDFRIAYSNCLTQHLRTVGVASIYGRTKMIFSCDKSRHLRARILEANLPPDFCILMIEAVKTLNGTKVLDFPPGSKIDGFNFTIGWQNPDPPPQVAERVSALLRSNRTSGVVTQVGLNAQANGLPAGGQRSLNGQVLPGEGVKADASGKLAGMTFNAEVSGQIIPKAAPAAMKAEALKLK
jgi:hypothetical protein